MDFANTMSTFKASRAYDYASVQSVIDEIERYVTRDPVDAQIVSFDFSTRTFTFSEDQPGVTIDGAALYNQVIGLLEQGEVNRAITVSPTLTLPTVTKQDLTEHLQAGRRLYHQNHVG